MLEHYRILHTLVISNRIKVKCIKSLCLSRDDTGRVNVYFCWQKLPLNRIFRNTNIINGKSFGLNQSRFIRSSSCKKINDDSVQRRSMDRSHFGAANLRLSLRMTIQLRSIRYQRKQSNWNKDARRGVHPANSEYDRPSLSTTGVTRYSRKYVQF